MYDLLVHEAALRCACWSHHCWPPSTAGRALLPPGPAAAMVRQAALGVALATCCATLGARAGSERCVPKLTAVKEVRTAGSAGWEFWAQGQQHFLATANFWDGRSRDMSADSEIFSVAAAPGVLGGLTVKSTQKIRGKGAHGVDFFSAHGRELLVVPSYYGCGQKAQAGPRESWQCKSTAVLEWREVLGAFVEVTTLGTHGPAQTDHYTDRDGQPYLVIGENFVRSVATIVADRPASTSTCYGDCVDPKL